MLQANKANLITGFHSGSIQSRYKEIKYFLSVLNQFSSMAGLLAGFSASVIVAVSGENCPNEKVALLYVISSGSALGFMLLVLLISTVTTMWGTGLALRGNSSEAVDKAVELMEASVNCSLRCFIIGLLFFFISAYLSLWIRYFFVIGLVSSTLLGYAALKIYETSTQTYNDLLPDKIVSGYIHGDPAREIKPPSSPSRV